MLTTLKDMTREDVLNAIGLQTRREPTSYLAPILGIFGAGVLIGVGVGFLLAPKAGKDLRQDMTDKVTDAADRVKRIGSDVLNSAKNFADIGSDIQQDIAGVFGQHQAQGPKEQLGQAPRSPHNLPAQQAQKEQQGQKEQPAQPITRNAQRPEATH